MSARRYFVEGIRHAGDVVTIGGGDARKIATVLRLRDGARIEVVDSGGSLFDATIEVRDRNVLATLVAELPVENESGRSRVDIAQAVPKGQKMDFVVEKSTELGAAAILPFLSERTIARDAVGAAKVERWRRIAKTAAQQSGRRDVPNVETPMEFDRLLERFGEYDAVLFPWELAPREPARERLPAITAGARRVLVVVGPEGGFTHAEAEAARDRGAHWLWLGRRILRTETAAMVLLAILEYL